jgi:hypothetical protein
MYGGQLWSDSLNLWYLQYIITPCELSFYIVPIDTGTFIVLLGKFFCLLSREDSIHFFQPSFHSCFHILGFDFLNVLPELEMCSGIWEAQI